MTSVVDHLAALVRIASPSSASNRPVAEYAAEILFAAGWSTRGLPYRDGNGVEKVNLIAAPPGQNLTDHAADLVLMCHTDTVPFAADWADALNPKIVDGHLHGCGACDVKGFLACVLTAASGAGEPAYVDGLRVVLTADEEVGCVGASRLAADNILRPRQMIIGEPTMLEPARAGKGYCLAEIVVNGKEAHSAHPAQGVSAIFHAARLLTEIEGLSRKLATNVNSFFSPGYTTLNVGTIQGGSAKNIVPGECRLQLEWRPVPGQDADAVLQSVAAIIARMSEADPTFHAGIRPLRRQDGFETAASAPLVRRMEELTGRASTSIPFGSEASIFAARADEVIVFGPGDMRTAHSNRECVPLAELDEAVRILGSLMRGA